MNQSNEKIDEKNVPAPAYLKLIDDCWYHIFDYLSATDIVRMSATCKHLLQVSGNYLNDNCSDLDFHVKCNQIAHFDNESTKIEQDFYAYIKKIYFQGENFENKIAFLQSVSIANHFDSLQTIEFAFITIYQPDFHSSRQILKSVKNLKLNFTRILSESIFTTIANYATELTHLTVKNSTNGISLFYEKYNNLEFLEYDACTMSEIHIDNIKDFLEYHTKLTQFNIDYFGLWANKTMLDNTHIQLDTLGVSFSYYAMTLEPLMEMTDQLIALHQNGLFKYLSLSINYALHARDMILLKQPIITLARALCIKKLYLSKIKDTYFDFFAYELKDLEHLTIDYVYNTSEIIEFVRHLKNLQSISIKYIFKDGVNVYPEILNNEREKLKDAKKIRLYLHNRNYLFAKWKLPNLNFTKLKIVRIEKRNNI